MIPNSNFNHCYTELKERGFEIVRSEGGILIAEYAGYHELRKCDTGLTAKVTFDDGKFKIEAPPEFHANRLLIKYLRRCTGNRHRYHGEYFQCSIMQNGIISLPPEIRIKLPIENYLEEQNNKDLKSIIDSAVQERYKIVSKGVVEGTLRGLGILEYPELIRLT